MNQAKETEKKKHYPFGETYLILTCRCPACDITFEAPAKRAISEDMFKGISCIECETANVNVIHSKGEKGKFMKIVCIPADKPYSIVIVEHDDELYCVEGYDYENDVEAWEIGSLQACCIVFDEIKQMLTESGRTVCEVGTHLSTIMQPRQMLINHTPLNVWKAIYRNLQLKDRIAKTDKILSEVRGTREVNGNDNPNTAC